jgi:hypothetical protein
VTVDGAVALEVGPARAGPSPWSISHVQPDGGEELRIELPAPPAAGTAAQVVVGHWDADTNQFQPCLTVGADCTVTLTGDLVVEGSVTMHGELFAPGLGPDATRAAMSSFLTGVGSAGTLLGQLFPSPIGEVLTSEAGLRRVARELANNPGRREAFAALVKEIHPDLAGQLSEDLRPGPGGS